MKKCYKCQIEREENEFAKNKTWCKICTSDYLKTYNSINKDKIAKQKREYNIKREKEIKQNKKEYYSNNRDALLLSQKEYQNSHKKKKEMNILLQDMKMILYIGAE